MEINGNIGAKPVSISGNPTAQAAQQATHSSVMREEEKQTRPVVPTDAQPLSDDEQRQIDEMKHRENEVRTHEQAHRTAGGRYVRGGINYDYETGPDGKRYITGGEVSIDTTPIPNDPKATAEKMQTVRRAAMAPAQPSQQDRSVAAQAQRVEAQARQEMAQETLENSAVDGKLTGDGIKSEGMALSTDDKAGTASGQPLEGLQQTGLPPQSVSYGQNTNATAATPRLNLLA